MAGWVDRLPPAAGAEFPSSGVIFVHKIEGQLVCIPLCNCCTDPGTA